MKLRQYGLAASMALNVTLLAWVFALARTPSAFAAQSDVCPTQSSVVICIAVTVTPAVQTSATPTPVLSATPTVTSTATMQPTILVVTPIPAPAQCTYPGVDSSGKGQQYTYTDPQQSNLRQNVRTSPALGLNIVAYLAKGSTVPVFWHIRREGYDWYSLDQSCSRWIAMLGNLSSIP